MMNINHEQAKALARYVTTIRSDWHIDGILTAIGKVRDQAPIETLTMWAVRAALEPHNRTPAVIAMPGPHRETPKADVRSYNIACSDHPDEQLPCGRCVSERVPADEPNAAALARAQLSQALARLCPHKVDRRIVRCAECEKPAPKQPEPPAEPQPEPVESEANEESAQ